METNTLANVSLGSAIGMLVMFAVQWCLGFIPFLGILAIFLYPIEWILAFVALVTGILGFRTAAAMDGAGKGASIAGILISLMWMLFQVVVWMLLFFFVGGAIILDSL